MTVYSGNTDRTRLNWKERRHLADMLKGKGPNAIEGLDLRTSRQAIARAPRSEEDKAGRRWQLGENSAGMVQQLMYLEGKGEADDCWLHKSDRYWFEEDSTLTERKLRTAKRVLREEGLAEIEVGPRPGDGLRTTWYRLNMWRVAQVVVESELENTERRLTHEGRKKERSKLKRRRSELQRTLDDLNLDFAGEQDPGDPEPEGEMSTVCPQDHDDLAVLQEGTQESTYVDHRSTPVREGTEAGKIMNGIYNRLKDGGYRLDNKEYAHNLRSVKSVLENDGATEKELAVLPEACLEYFVWHLSLDVAKALRRWRQQAARSKLEAGMSRRSGKSGRRGRPTRRELAEEHAGPFGEFLTRVLAHGSPVSTTFF